MAQGPGVEDGQWTYLGGDAWHTRYTPADQINASNFENLKLAWRFNASSFGPSTPRATPSYVDGKLITVTGERRHVIALDPATGELLWSFTEPKTFRHEYSMRKGYGKGVAYAKVDGNTVTFLSRSINMLTVGRVPGHSVDWYQIGVQGGFAADDIIIVTSAGGEVGITYGAWIDGSLLKIRSDSGYDSVFSVVVYRP